jgi:antitoxin HicB
MLIQTNPTNNPEYYQNLKYPTELVEEDDGRFVASIPDLPGCVSYGEDPNEAIRGVKVAKDLWIKGRIESGQEIPEPTEIEDFSGKFVLRIPRSLHKSLDYEAKREGISLNAYVSYLLSERRPIRALQRVLENVVPITQLSWSSLRENWGLGARPIILQDRGNVNLDILQFLPKPPDCFSFSADKKQLSAAKKAFIECES